MSSEDLSQMVLFCSKWSGLEIKLLLPLYICVNCTIVGCYVVMTVTVQILMCVDWLYVHTYQQSSVMFW